MKARFNGNQWTIGMTARQYYRYVVNFFWGNPVPTCDALHRALVPEGVPDIAKGDERRFGVGGIYKYRFVSSDGIELMVKYHCVDPKAATNHPGCNASKGWTVQIVCDFCSFLTWDPIKKRAGKAAVSCHRASKGVAPRCDRTHILLQSGPSSCLESMCTAHGTQPLSVG